MLPIEYRAKDLVSKRNKMDTVEGKPSGSCIQDTPDNLYEAMKELTPKGPDIANCTVAVISRPLGFSSGGYVKIGEVPSERKDLETLQRLHDELQALPPFQHISTPKGPLCENTHDLEYFRAKYGLTGSIATVGDAYALSTTLSPPYLYDLSCDTPLFKKTGEKEVHTLERDDSRPPRMYIVVPCTDPVERAQIVNEIVEYLKSDDVCVFIGGRGAREGSIALLAARYLVYRSPEAKVFVMPDIRPPRGLLAAHQHVMKKTGYIDYQPFLASSLADMKGSLAFIRSERRRDYQTPRFRFLCPYPGCPDN